MCMFGRIWIYIQAILRARGDFIPGDNKKNVILPDTSRFICPVHTDVAQSVAYPLSVLFPALLTSSFPVSDGMTDQGNRLSYILINPSPDTRLELHDIVWVHPTKCCG